MIFNKASNDTAAEFVRDKIRAMVKDPAKAELLAPKDHPIGTKRICVDTDYYLTYNRPNVSLVNVRGAPIHAITPNGLRAGDSFRRVRKADTPQPARCITPRSSASLAGQPAGHS